MAKLFFRFQEHASEENQAQVQKEILKRPGVRAVARIDPSATMDSLRRLWYVDVADDKAAADLVTQLREHDDIQSADLPPQRGLV